MVVVVMSALDSDRAARAGAAKAGGVRHAAVRHRGAQNNDQNIHDEIVPKRKKTV